MSKSKKWDTHGALPVFCALIIACLTLTFCAGCATTANRLAATPAGSTLIAQAANKVVKKGLNAGADQLDSYGNPYLHSVADALRSNPDAIVDPGLVQKIFTDYGDPANKTKFKTLAWDVWALAKDAALRIGKENAAELIARGLQTGAEKK